MFHKIFSRFIKIPMGNKISYICIPDNLFDCGQWRGKESVCLSVHLSSCISIYLSVCLCASQFICLSINVYVCLSVCKCICLYINLSVCISIYLSVCLSIYMSLLSLYSLNFPTLHKFFPRFIPDNLFDCGQRRGKE